MLHFSIGLLTAACCCLAEQNKFTTQQLSKIGSTQTTRKSGQCRLICMQRDLTTMGTCVRLGRAPRRIPIHSGVWRCVLCPRALPAA